VRAKISVINGCITLAKFLLQWNLDISNHKGNEKTSNELSSISIHQGFIYQGDF